MLSGMKSPLCLLDVVIFAVIDERLHVLAGFSRWVDMPGGCCVAGGLGAVISVKP
jgi:hypothetical protein